MTTSERAAQIWSVLIYAAYHRQTITADVLGRLIGVPAPRVGRLLEPIGRYCEARKLPALTSIVVGLSDDSSQALSEADSHLAQSAVYHFHWLEARVPVPADFD